MTKIIAKVLFVKVGKVTINKKLGSKKEFLSGIKKYPQKSAYIEKNGFKEDEQSDLLHHGGETKAVLLFSTNTYNKLNELSNNDFTYDTMAHYGENLVVEGISEADVCVGDVLKIGDATIEVSQPRQPCWKLSANTKTKNMTSIIYNNGLTGWYARVIEDGTISQNDEIFLLKRAYAELTIEVLNQIIVDPLSDGQLTKKALACDALGRQFKNSLEQRAKLKDPKNEPFLYHKEPDAQT
ncbi:MOSC domain-containing protein [Sulfurimonas sp.]|jgi:MOSC domain-containing protein YiiM|uniref:MOSC domain-containing protein n=1 Tax=Sulfurimonas sp. TaxID=2022749 RepID=UPI0025D825E2|nr:MOSC domain-containing protein [Sulfurimonas sp.]MCK9473886.1 MOSC domain-containing protein [Sulfurimonas sp.]MDD3506018.1 MOSC domain-containing protein [Sulfurimonas sp.]